MQDIQDILKILNEGNLLMNFASWIIGGLFAIVNALIGIIVWFIKKDLELTKKDIEVSKQKAELALSKANQVEVSHLEMIKNIELRLADKIAKVGTDIIKEIQELEQRFSDKFITRDECDRIHRLE